MHIPFCWYTDAEMPWPERFVLPKPTRQGLLLAFLFSHEENGLFPKIKEEVHNELGMKCKSSEPQFSAFTKHLFPRERKLTKPLRILPTHLKSLES